MQLPFFSSDQPTLSKLSRKILALPTSKKLRLAEPLAEEKVRSRTPLPDVVHRQHWRLSEPYNGVPEDGRQRLRETDANSRPLAPSRTNSAALLTRCHICHRKPAKVADLDSFADCYGCGERTCFVCLRECPGWTELDDVMIREPEEEDLVASFHMADPHEEVDEGMGRRRRNGAKAKSGWAQNGHRKTVCSRCCVERGPDGDVVCLGCLPYVDG
jgi:hypothetical protein